MSWDELLWLKIWRLPNSVKEVLDPLDGIVKKQVPDQDDEVSTVDLVLSLNQNPTAVEKFTSI